MTEPTKRYVVKYENKPLAARTYHTYVDCSYLLSMMAPTEGPSTLIEPSAELLALMELRLCKGCEERALEVPAEDVIAEAAGIDKATALKVIAALEANNLILKRVKRRKSLDS